jgi:hypothetical protein
MFWNRCKTELAGLTITLILCLSPIFVSGQVVDEDQDTEIVVPDKVMKQVVPRVFRWYFKPRERKQIIYVSSTRVEESWLPEISNIEFRLLSAKEIQEQERRVYFFTKPQFEGTSYSIGFAFGDPTCDYSGDYWHFRIGKGRLRLWESGGVGGGCGSSHSADF